MYIMYEKVVLVVVKLVEEWIDIECMDLVVWFRNKFLFF